MRRSLLRLTAGMLATLAGIAAAPSASALQIGVEPVKRIVEAVVQQPGTGAGAALPTVPALPPPPEPPAIPVPSLPPVPSPPPVPAPSVPRSPAPLPLVGSGGSGGGGSQSAPAAPAARPAEDGAGSPESGAPASSGGSSTAPAVPPRGSSGRRTGGAPWSGATTDSTAQRRIRERVAKLQGCLDELGSGERRVLAFRAGIGPRPALSRTEVARRLDLSVSRAGRIERSGMRHLDRLDAAGSCGGGVAAATAFAASGSGDVAAAGVSGGSAEARRPRSGIGGVTAEGGPSDANGPSDSDGPVFTFGQGRGGSMLALIGLLVVLGLLVRRELSRR